MTRHWLPVALATLVCVVATPLGAMPPSPTTLHVDDALASPDTEMPEANDVPEATAPDDPATGLDTASGPSLTPQPDPPPEGDAFYCHERRLGTWFYCEKPRAPAYAASANAPASSYRQQLDSIGKQLEELKAKAILEPTPEHIIDYVRYQRAQLDRASTFADVWQRAVWQHPDLDYTLQRPVETLAKTEWLTQRKTDREATMGALPERYGLFYFYSSACSACAVFSPIVRSLADRWHLGILAVSMDGGPNPEFPRFVVNHGQYEKMGLEGGLVPALVLFDTLLKRPIPIGYGVMAEDEVMARIFTLTTVKPGSDY